MTSSTSLTIPEMRLPADLSDIPTDELKRLLSAAIGVTAKTLASLAQIWMELERRGEDLSALRSGLMAYLPMIADGRLDPELVVRCAGQAMLLRAASSLSLDEQRELLSRGAPLIEIDDEQKIVERRIPLEQINAHQVRRVFAGDHIRPPAEQAKLLTPNERARSQTRGVIVKVRLTQEEYAQIRAVTARKNVRIPKLARDLLLEYAERST